MVLACKGSSGTLVSAGALGQGLQIRQREYDHQLAARCGAGVRARAVSREASLFVETLGQRFLYFSWSAAANAQSSSRILARTLAQLHACERAQPQN
eukprot:6178295-Pleurochrysis_carterae.AAC.1